MPRNTGNFFEQLTVIAAFDVYEIGDYLNGILDLEPTEVVND